MYKQWGRKQYFWNWLNFKWQRWIFAFSARGFHSSFVIKTIQFLQHRLCTYNFFLLILIYIGILIQYFSYLNSNLFHFIANFLLQLWGMVWKEENFLNEKVFCSSVRLALAALQKYCRFSYSLFFFFCFKVIALEKNT